MLQKDCAIVLAAGKGKRMGSDVPKVLKEVLFEPMLSWVLRSCEQIGLTDRCVVVGHQAEQVEAYLGGRATTAVQKEQAGTGHAVLCAEEFLGKHMDGNVAVLCGDAPLLDSETLHSALKQHKETSASVTVITAEIEKPCGYGRIIRKNGALTEIVEEKDASDDQRAIKEINSGAYWFAVKDLLPALKQLRPANAQGEYYLTDVVRLMIEQGKTAQAFCAGSMFQKDCGNPWVALGANDPLGLFELNQIARKMIIRKHIVNGVEFLSDDGICISPLVEIGKGTKILPGTILRGNTSIGNRCVIGPNTLIQDSVICDDCAINASQVICSKVADHVSVGPFSQLRPNTSLEHHVKIGDFVEIKNSSLGAGTAVSHLTYIGDSNVGKNVNFGCGVVTVNYDGVKKHRCVIGDGAFIGCNTNLIAPVTLGDNSYTGAGSTITKDVPDQALGIARARQKNIDNFSKTKLKGRKLKVKEE